MKVGRNDPCPCNSGKKYKRCCLRRANSIKANQKTGDTKSLLSVRERNGLFLQRILEVLQFDKEQYPKALNQFKAAFTYDAVKKINEAIIEIWPPDTPIYPVLDSTRAEVSGLYVGEYEPELLIRAVSRHSLYANKILLVDPFIYPLSVRDQYNPILHPELYRTQTLRNVRLWFQLAPWLEAGIVEIIRTPADFDSHLNWESMLRQKQKFEDNEELKKVLEETVAEKMKDFEKAEGLRLMVLGAPDDYLRNVIRELRLGEDPADEDTFINHIHKLRREDPYYLDPTEAELSAKKRGEFHITSSGASYDIAKITAAHTGSYLVTDIPSRWKEIEVDRSGKGIAESEWSPLAKAFQNIDLKYLNCVELQHALSLRNEGRLQSLRTFLKHLWGAACTGDPYGSQNVQHLADELGVKIKEAEEEWKQIDRDLLKWLGGEAAAALVSGPPLIETGHAAFLAAAFTVAGLATLGATKLKRKGFPDKFPAAFFMKLKKSK